MHRPFFLSWRGRAKRATSRSGAAGSNRIDVVAGARRGPVAVHRLRLEHALGLGLLEQVDQDRLQLLGRPGEELGQRAAVLLVAPVELEQHVLIEVRHERGDLNVVEHARPPERRLRYFDAARELVAPHPRLFQVDRTDRGHLAVHRRERARGLAPLGPGRLLRLTLGEVGIEAAAHDPVHQVQAVERVARVGDPTRLIGLDAVLLDILAGQRGAAQHDRDVETHAAHLEHVLAHDHGRLDQQAGHADGVGAMLLGGGEDVGRAAA